MSLVIFDLDGTLINGQSQQYLIFYLYKKKQISLFKLTVIFLWFFAYKFALVNDPRWPLNYAFAIIQGKSEQEVDQLINSFYEEKLKYKFNDNILKKLKNHQEKGDKVVLITNAVNPIAEIVAKKLRIKKIFSTKLEKNNKIYTGGIGGDIIYGEKKAELLKNNFSKEDLKNSYAYADHYSDIFLFNLVDNPNLVNASKKTLKFFKYNYKKNNLEIY